MPFILETNAGYDALDAILCQKIDNDKYMVANALIQLSKAEKTIRSLTKKVLLSL